MKRLILTAIIAGCSIATERFYLRPAMLNRAVKKNYIDPANQCHNEFMFALATWQATYPNNSLDDSEFKKIILRINKNREYFESVSAELASRINHDKEHYEVIHLLISRANDLKDDYQRARSLMVEPVANVDE